MTLTELRNLCRQGREFRDQHHWCYEDWHSDDRPCPVRGTCKQYKAFLCWVAPWLDEPEHPSYPQLLEPFGIVGGQGELGI